MKSIGIVGGVGPLAGVDLHTKIIRNTIAHKDQDHLPVYHISVSNTILDRTEYYLNPSMRNPAIDIFTVIQKLHQLQCQVVGIPCNSTHIPCIRESMENMLEKNKLSDEVQVLHMIREVAKHLKSLGIKKAGLLATKGSVQSQLYQGIMKEFHIHIAVPATEAQVQRVHSSIYHHEYGIKSTPAVTDTARTILLEEANHLVQEGVECIILGCTELPLALTQDMTDTPLIDATNILARALIYHSNPSKLLA